MKLPNAEAAFVDVRKLSDYCLNPEHPRGKHKARVFANALGITQDDSEELRLVLLRQAIEGDAAVTATDLYGTRYILDFVLARRDYRAEIRSSWIIRKDEDFPRLTSCFVL